MQALSAQALQTALLSPAKVRIVRLQRMVEREDKFAESGRKMALQAQGYATRFKSEFRILINLRALDWRRAPRMWHLSIYPSKMLRFRVDERMWGIHRAFPLRTDFDST